MDVENMAEMLFQQIKEGTSTPISEMLDEFNCGEIGVLSTLAFDQNPVTAGELSEKLNVTTARIARILNSLESKQYIRRKNDRTDRRKIFVTITKKGKELADSTKKEIMDKIVQVIQEVGYDEIQTYISIVLKIRSVLNNQDTISKRRDARVETEKNQQSLSNR